MHSNSRTHEPKPRGRDKRGREVWQIQGELEGQFIMPRDEAGKKHAAHNVERFGPLPGEVYPDEAHFGSFS